MDAPIFMENNKKNSAKKRYTKYDLLLGNIGQSRHKAIGTLAKRKGLSYEKARLYQAFKILEKNGA